jgi:excisionase family DNA binding protein
MTNKTNSKYVTTTEACDLIGVSKTVIKRLADEGILKIWKTPGGHRRLLRSSVDEYIMQNGRERANEDDGILKVLIVDDDRVSIDMVKSMAKSLDFPMKILTAKDGYEGLINAGRYKPEIILSDLNMPQMDGYSMVQAMRNFETTKEATIIVMTGLDPKDIKRDKLPKDITVLHKPIQPDILKQFLTYEFNLKRG